MTTVIGNKKFGNKTYIMGILNVTPDSFSDGGIFTTADCILKRCEEMIEQGADIIDIGGESTRPGFVPVSENEEIERVSSALTLIKSNFDIPVSVDTYKYNVAHFALLNGADMINDIWGFKKSPEIAQIVKQFNAGCCIMHNRENSDYNDFFNNLIDDLKHSISIAKSNNIEEEKIIIDAGVGFAKNTSQNLEAIKRTKEISNLCGYPVMVAVSRKSVIGNVLNVDLPQRLSGTLATTAYAYFCGAKFVRVHDIAENKHILNMLEAIEKGEAYE